MRGIANSVAFSRRFVGFFGNLCESSFKLAKRRRQTKRRRAKPRQTIPCLGKMREEEEEEDPRRSIPRVISAWE
eukprot:999640-Prymnesium_polylepis.1